MPEPTIHARIDGHLVMVGFGSIGKGSLPLILRHIDVARDRMVIIDPDDSARAIAEFAGIRFEKVALQPDTLRSVLAPLLAPGGFLVNVSVGVSSVALMELCREHGRALSRHLHRAAAGRLHRSRQVDLPAVQLRDAGIRAGAAPSRP